MSFFLHWHRSHLLHSCRPSCWSHDGRLFICYRVCASPWCDKGVCWMPLFFASFYADSYASSLRWSMLYLMRCHFIPAREGGAWKNGKCHHHVPYLRRGRDSQPLPLQMAWRESKWQQAWALSPARNMGIEKPPKAQTWGAFCMSEMVSPPHSSHP